MMGYGRGARCEKQFTFGLAADLTRIVVPCSCSSSSESRANDGGSIAALTDDPDRKRRTPQQRNFIPYPSRQHLAAIPLPQPCFPNPASHSVA
jgi:hypothetical protein